VAHAQHTTQQAQGRTRSTRRLGLSPNRRPSALPPAHTLRARRRSLEAAQRTSACKPLCSHSACSKADTAVQSLVVQMHSWPQPVSALVQDGSPPTLLSPCPSPLAQVHCDVSGQRWRGGPCCGPCWAGTAPSAAAAPAAHRPPGTTAGGQHGPGCLSFACCSRQCAPIRVLPVQRCMCEACARVACQPASWPAPDLLHRRVVRNARSDNFSCPPPQRGVWRLQQLHEHRQAPDLVQVCIGRHSGTQTNIRVMAPRGGGARWLIQEQRRTGSRTKAPLPAALPGLHQTHNSTLRFWQSTPTFGVVYGRHDVLQLLQQGLLLL
jgi:hypothetical protein